MMSALALAILALATYRLAHLVTIEDGPAKLFQRLRLFAGAYQIADGSWQAESFFGKLLSCFPCCSIWAAGLLYAVFIYLPGIYWLVVILALSGAACLLYRLTER